MRVALAGGRGRVDVERRGHGAPPILLLRPLGGSMALWGRFAERLAAEREVIAFDPRGVGASSDLPLLATTRDLAADAAALLDALAVDRAHVFGLSLGGMVASWLAIDAPARVERLILASTLPRAAKVSTRARRAALPLAGALLRSEIALVREILSPELRRQHPGRVREILRLVRAHPTRPRTLAALALAAARHDAGAALARIAAPTLLMVGQRDPLVGRRAEAELLQGIPGARLAVVAGAGHDLTLEQPEATAAQVNLFLAGGAG